MLGNDILYGGIGNDKYVTALNNNSGTTSITEYSNEGLDIVETGGSYTLADNLENLTLLGTNPNYATGNALNNTIIGNVGNNLLRGEGGDDTVLGGSGNDFIYGGSETVTLSNTGNDELNGGAGNDVMNGQDGNDSYIVDSTGDVIIEDSSTGGTDTVYSTIYWTLGTNLEKLTLQGTNPNSGTGNALNNTIIGNAAYKLLDGSTGSDTMRG